MKQITFSEALEGYMIFAQTRLSENTIRDYLNTFTKFQKFLGEDLYLDDIGVSLIEKFMFSYRQMAKKTLVNYHIALCALWTWAYDRKFVNEKIPQQYQPPKPDAIEIIPYSETDLKAMLMFCTVSKFYTRPGTRDTQRGIPEGERLKTILYLLLDTGMRASEVCNLKIRDIDLPNHYLKVMGKGRKERVIPLSPKMEQILWRHMFEKKNQPLNRPVFTTNSGQALRRDNLLKSIYRLAKRAGVKDANIHRFRHTFAINCLRYGGKTVMLQRILGHSTLEMTKRYLAIAEVDIQEDHKIASPVMNLGI